MMARTATLQNRIAAQKRKIAVLDDRIGRMMSQRVTEEDKLADLYGLLANSPSTGDQS